MEHGTYMFMGSGVDEKPVSTFDGRGSSRTMRSRRGDFKELQYDTSTVVKDSIVGYVR